MVFSRPPPPVVTTSVTPPSSAAVTGSSLLDNLPFVQNQLRNVFYLTKDSPKGDLQGVYHLNELKTEFDDGTFNTENAYVEQDDILRMRLENRRASLTPGSSQAEVLNVLGPLTTINKGLELNGAEEIKSLSD